MNQYEIVPLAAGDSALPVFEDSLPSIVFAEVSLSSPIYQTVRIDDSSRYEVVPLAAGADRVDTWR